LPTKGEKDEFSGTETTGHVWDGIRELNTPLPRWWLWVWLGCIVWAIGYWIVMPAWPGITGHSDNPRSPSIVFNVMAAAVSAPKDFPA